MKALIRKMPLQFDRKHFVLMMSCALGVTIFATTQAKIQSTDNYPEEVDRNIQPVTSASTPVAIQTDFSVPSQENSFVRLCQALGPAAPHSIAAVDCADGHCGDGRFGDMRWGGSLTTPWQAFAQGEYVGHPRTAHVPKYRLRVDDQLEFRYRITRRETSTPYTLDVGDVVRIESFTDEKIKREVEIQPDGYVTLPLIGMARAARMTAPEFRDSLEKLFKKYMPNPSMTVTPVKLNARLEDLRSVVDSRYGTGGQTITARITPDGTIALPGIGSAVAAQGLTLEELQKEIHARYSKVARIQGMEVTPLLVNRAPRFVYVLGEVGRPGRIELTGPTTVLQALAMAGSWNVGAHLRQVVVFRRGDDWRLMATKLDLQAALHGRQTCPAGEIWLSDADVIIVPKSPILEADDWIELIFTRGIYGVIPFQGISINMSKLSTL